MEVDIIYIIFMMRALYTGLLGTVQDSRTTTEHTCTRYVIKPDRGVLNHSPVE